MGEWLALRNTSPSGSTIVRFFKPLTTAVRRLDRRRPPCTCPFTPHRSTADGRPRQAAEPPPGSTANPAIRTAVHQDLPGVPRPVRDGPRHPLLGPAAEVGAGRTGPTAGHRRVGRTPSRPPSDTCWPQPSRRSWHRPTRRLQLKPAPAGSVGEPRPCDRPHFRRPSYGNLDAPLPHAPHQTHHPLRRPSRSTPRLQQVLGMFDVPPSPTSEVAWDVDLTLPDGWHVGA